MGEDAETLFKQAIVAHEAGKEARAEDLATRALAAAPEAKLATHIQHLRPRRQAQQRYQILCRRGKDKRNREAVEYLIGLGHRRIGFVGDTAFSQPPAGLGFTSSSDRLRGYKQALAAAGIDVEPGLIRRGPHDAAVAAEHAAQLLKSPDPPSAIFAASDTQAIGVLAAADRLGVAVPGQLSVVGFDDIESAAFLNLSTIRQPLARSGTEGAQRLCALLRGERVRPLRQELPIELMARGSSARVTTRGR